MLLDAAELISARSFVKVGDLVKHDPDSSCAMKKLYEDWGHKRDFDAGIILYTKNEFAHVLHAAASGKSGWYQFEELEVISESR